MTRREPLATASVVVPTRDRWPFLRQAIDAVLAQEGVDVEVVVVDDGSQDESPDRLSQLGDRRLTVIRHDRPLGVAAARNRGIAAANGDWIGLLDDDDLWSPVKLKTQIGAAAREGAEWAYAASIVVDELRRPLRLSMLPPDPGRVLQKLLRRNVMPAGSSNVIASARLLRKLGGFDERLHQLADWDLWIRLAAAARPAACSDVLVAYTEHSRNMLVQSSHALIDELDYIESKHRALCAQAGSRVDRRATWRWIAWAQRRSGRRGSAVSTYLRAAIAERSPGDLVRAAAALLGERAMRGVRSPHGAQLPELDWLGRYA
jgi:glycosyltransferase involved in cell wall biosynthesis